MTQNLQQFIPAGRTARFEMNGREIQVQTEFAPRPTPRITTTVLASGEVLKKSETQLDSAIQSAEELQKVERLLLRQHSEAVKRLKEDNPERSKLSFTSPRGIPTVDVAGVKPVGERMAVDASSSKTNVSKEEPSESHTDTKPLQISQIAQKLSDSERVSMVKRTTLERLYSVDGVDKIFTLDWRGNFVNAKSRDEFKRTHNKLFKHIADLVEIFAELPGGRGRENGIYEATPRRLYMVSHSGFIYFLQVNHAPSGGKLEEVIRRALDS